MKKIIYLLFICLLSVTITSCDNNKTIDKTIDKTTDSKADNWKKVYKEFLTKADLQYDNKARFELCYITNDDIPEIVIIHGTGQPSGAMIYTYFNGNVIEFTRGGSGGMTYGQWGTIWYKEKEDLIYERCYTDKDSPYYQHLISYVHDDYITDYKHQVSDFYGSERIDDNGNLIKTRYEVNGAPVDEAEYFNKCEEYGIDDIDTTYKKVEYDSMAELNENNISTSLK